MLVWATEFPLRIGCTIEDVIIISKKWLTGSIHSSWSMDILVDEKDNAITEFENDGQKVKIAKITIGTKKLAGFLYKWTENTERNWTTEIVAFKNGQDILFSIRLYCESLVPGLPMSLPKKPHIVRQILTELGGGNDGGLPISNRPIFLREQEVDKAAKIVLGKNHNHLPIIYVSSLWNGETAVDVHKLAIWACGMAHVIVEPSRFFSFALARNVKQQNAYNGAISIYWPGQEEQHARLLPATYSSPVRIATKAARLVSNALIAARLTPECTWSYIEECIADFNYNELKKSGSKNIDEYIKQFDSEIATKEENLRKAESEISRLKRTLQRANARSDSLGYGVIEPGKEQQFYAGEVRDVIIKALKKTQDSFQKNGRCADIIKDILATNRQSDEQEQIENQIKRILGASYNIAKKERSSLENIGFSFREDGKHIEATYHDDPRYVFTISKTSSDNRSMRNLISEICKKLFQ